MASLDRGISWKIANIIPPAGVTRSGGPNSTQLGQAQYPILRLYVTVVSYVDGGCLIHVINSLNLHRSGLIYHVIREACPLLKSSYLKPCSRHENVVSMNFVPPEI